jgi:superfamily II DNA helicase RecQ
LALLSSFTTFFISAFGESTVSDDLNRFLKAYRIIDVEKKFIDSERGTGWAVLVEYAQDSKQASSSGPKVDYQAILSEQEFAFFSYLRDLRKSMAEKQAVPVYAIFTNEQLSQMVKKTPKTIQELMQIPGIGEAKAKQYGDVFLQAIKKYNSKDES